MKDAERHRKIDNIRNKLQTLRDLVKTKRTDTGEDCEAWIPDASVLKNAAINWIRYLQEEPHVYLEYSIQSTADIISWIKNFFNIKEEDLNDDKQ